MHQIILHHYPQSPVAEKVRIVLGIKSLKWCSVEIPRMPPKPDLMPLTGGYRRTPVMQIGADIYCDSLCIIRELERRFPRPTLFPDAQEGLAWGLSQWTDGPIFKNIITIALGAVEDLPEDFAKDRGRLYFGTQFNLAQLQADISHCATQVRSQFGCFERVLADGRPYMSGSDPGLVDALVYYLVWFLRGRWHDGPAFVRQFQHISAWQQKMDDIGHGTSTEIASNQALDIARQSIPDTRVSPDPGDPMGLAPGMKVGIAPEGDGGDPVVPGEIIALSTDEIAIERTDPRVEKVVVHFPRAGYYIKRL